MRSTRCSCHILKKIDFSQHVFETLANIKFHENPFSGKLSYFPADETDGQTDMTRLISLFLILQVRLKTEVYRRRRNYLRATSSTTNLTRSDPVLDPNLRVERPISEHQNMKWTKATNFV